MKKEDIQQYLGKKVLLELSNNFHYTCIINSVTEDTISFIDKFNLKHTKNISEIIGINEVRND